jgi:hypothetical protein
VSKTSPEILLIIHPLCANVLGLELELEQSMCVAEVDMNYISLISPRKECITEARNF